jgi:hypothetical protein
LVDGVVFDNFLVTSDLSIAKQYADQLWNPKSILEGRPASPSTSTSSSKSVVDMIINATKKRPWLWAVYLAVILLAIIMIIGIYCWLRESKTTKSYDRIKKKSDDYIDDDDYEEEVEEIENDKRNIKFKINRKDALKKPSIGHKSRRCTRKE